MLDSAVWLDAVAGPAPGDAHSAPAPDRPFAESARSTPGKLRIAVSLKPATQARVHDVVRRAVEETAATLRSLGHEVSEADPDYGVLETVFGPRWTGGIYDDTKQMARPELLARRTRQIAWLGRLAGSSGALARALAAEPARARRMNRVFDDHDVLLTPTMPEPAHPLGRYDGRALPIAFRGASAVVAFTSPWNVTGQPAASVPSTVTDDGVPIGVQLVARPNDEATLLSLAAQLEAETRWPDRRPPLG